MSDISSPEITNSDLDRNEQQEVDEIYKESIINQVYAGFGIRFVSFVIDCLIISGFQGLVFKPIYHATHIDEVKLWINYFSIDHLITALVFYLYFVLMTKYFKQTLGKMICNIRVERVDRADLKWSDILFREWIGRIISGVCFNLPYLVVLFTPKHRGIHDYFANTVVIRNKFASVFYLKK
ncbi:RDD family protein [Staphylococcus sp. SQ8-PEA]|uniref:RDD family protein n=1 Tax=Staphylococcus marylandisciuri TaxID=2981529 RepID=A0ABT2QQ58_9STAP|nr:RDD family protein [Staphylococcus marylandisciuri]MCU5746113.1 RDD family protein [Staphylococcus marylandisciuri]